MVTAHKLLAHQQKDGDSPVSMVVQDSPEKRRLKIMDGLRRFIMVDTHAVKVGDLENNMESRPVVKPKFTRERQNVFVETGVSWRSIYEVRQILTILSAS